MQRDLNMDVFRVAKPNFEHIMYAMAGQTLEVIGAQLERDYEHRFESSSMLYISVHRTSGINYMTRRLARGSIIPRQNTRQLIFNTSTANLISQHFLIVLPLPFYFFHLFKRLVWFRNLHCCAQFLNLMLSSYP